MPKISALPTGTSLLGTEIIPIVQSATTKSFTAAQVKAASPFVDGADIYSPLTAAIAALGSNGGIIDIPAGTYTCSDTIELSKPVQLRGAAGFGNISTATKITWATNKTGIWIKYPFMGIGSVISGIALFSAGGSTGHGIRMDATASVDNCSINSFPQIGLRIVGDVGGTPASNVNGFYVARTTINTCGGDGIYIAGGDGNAGICILCTILDCGGWGINDDGFLGNTFVGCQTDSNVTGAYTTSQVSARSSWLGCYSEGNQPTSVFSQWSVIVGGLHAAGVSGGMYVNQGVITQFDCNGSSVSLTVGSSTVDTLLDVDANIGGNTTQILYWDSSVGCWGMGRHANLAGRTPIYITGDGTSIDDEAGTDIPQGNVVFPRGYWVPTTTAGRFRNVSDTTSMMELTDGITAPATRAGYARIYVDTADGDLKVKFGDGTVKTIVVDT